MCDTPRLGIEDLTQCLAAAQNPDRQRSSTDPNTAVSPCSQPTDGVSAGTIYQLMPADARLVQHASVNLQPAPQRPLRPLPTYGYYVLYPPTQGYAQETSHENGGSDHTVPTMHTMATFHTATPTHGTPAVHIPANTTYTGYNSMRLPEQNHSFTMPYTVHTPSSRAHSVSNSTTMMRAITDQTQGGVTCMGMSNISQTAPASPASSPNVITPGRPARSPIKMVCIRGKWYKETLEGKLVPAVTLRITSTKFYANGSEGQETKTTGPPGSS